jgi:tetratricopeptide (TPR) repeat protein
MALYVNGKASTTYVVLRLGYGERQEGSSVASLSKYYNNSALHFTDETQQAGHFHHRHRKTGLPNHNCILLKTPIILISLLKRPGLNKRQQERNREDMDLKTLGKVAHRLAKERKYQEAEEQYILILETNPNDVYALVGIGDLKRKRKAFRQAVSYYQRAREIEQDNKFALLGLGDAYRGLREVGKALEIWLYYLLLRPHDYKVMTRVGDGFRKKEDFDKAKKYYFMALKERPDDPYALIGLGDIYLKEGNNEAALDFFEKLSGDSVVALTSAAAIYRKQRKFEKALRYYQRILEINPQDSYAWHGKADCLRGMKDYESAIKAWNLAMKRGMNPRIALTRIGDAYVSLKDFEQAETYYTKALTLGYDKYAYLGMARIHARKNKIDKVKEIFSSLIENLPNDLRVAAEFKGFVKKYPRIGKDLPRA